MIPRAICWDFIGGTIKDLFFLFSKPKLSMIWLIIS